MTAAQFYTQFINNLLDLRDDGVLTQEDLDRIGDAVIPVLRDVLAPAIADEVAHYEDGRPEDDVEYDFHAVDDAKFDAAVESYEQGEVV